MGRRTQAATGSMAKRRRSYNEADSLTESLKRDCTGSWASRCVCVCVCVCVRSLLGLLNIREQRQQRHAPRLAWPGQRIQATTH